MLIYRPDGDVDRDPTELADSPTELAGMRIAVLDNGKPNAALVMTRAAHALAATTGATVPVVTKKGPRGRSANAAVPCAPDVFARVVEEADIAITGAADCGSCTAYSVHDTVELERAGRPTVLLTTTRFEPIARTLAANHGLPDIRLLVLDHPIGGTDATTLHARADAAADDLLRLFTAPPDSTWVRQDRSGQRQRSHGAGGTLDRAMDELRAMVGADGAGLDVIGMDDETATVRLRLIIPDDHCAECVLPGSSLEAVALDRLVAHGVRRVTIDDPRENRP